MFQLSPLEKEPYVDLLGVDVGTAFLFGHKYLFTVYHITQEPAPKYEVMGVFISDPLGPFKELQDLEVVGHVESELLDIAILKSRHVHSFRLASCTSSLQTFSTLYTTQRVEQPIVTLHKERAYPSELPCGSIAPLCPAASTSSRTRRGPSARPSSSC